MKNSRKKRSGLRYPVSERIFSVRLPALVRLSLPLAYNFGKTKYMNTHHTAKQLPTSTLLYAGLLLAGAAFHALLSPKWVMPVFAWVAPALLLFYFRHATIKKKVLWFAIAISISQIISAFDVFPYPLPVIVV